MELVFRCRYHLGMASSAGKTTSTHANDRVRKHREALRASGLRLVTRWVPDTRNPAFIAEYRLQWEVLAERYRKSKESHEELAYWESMQTDEGWI